MSGLDPSLWTPCQGGYDGRKGPETPPRRPRRTVDDDFNPSRQIDARRRHVLCEPRAPRGPSQSEAG
jgi:hypothetical protein